MTIPLTASATTCPRIWWNSFSKTELVPLVKATASSRLKLSHQQRHGQGQVQNFNGNQGAPNAPQSAPPMARQMASQGYQVTPAPQGVAMVRSPASQGYQGKPQGETMVRSPVSQGYQAGTRPVAQGVHMVRQSASQGGQATTTTAMLGGDARGWGPLPYHNLDRERQQR